jgi:GDPmannose 4,6-dehydratase
VEAMWLMLQQEKPDDYVIATGQTHSVDEFLTEAFSHVDLDWREYVELDPKYLRPAEVDLLIGDAAKAKRDLDWEPKVAFKDLVSLMVDADISMVSQQEHETFGDTDTASGGTSARL